MAENDFPPQQIAGEIVDYDNLHVRLTDSNKNNITSTNPLPIKEIQSVVCDCSTSTPLAENATYTGAWKDVLDYSNISIAVASDKASATNGLVLQWSMNGVDVDDTDSFSILAGGRKQFSFGITHRYIRVIYTNGAVAQTMFRLQVLLHVGSPKPSSHRIQDAIVDEDDAELVKAIISGKTPAGTFANASITNSGNFKVSLEEFESQVSVNNNTQLRTTIYDPYGFHAECTPMDELRTITPQRLVGAQHAGTSLDTNFWTASVGTGGTASVGGAQLTLNVGVTANNLTSVQSRRSARYIGGSSNRYRAVVQCGDIGTANNKRRWGAFDTNDGAFFELSGTAFGVVTKKGGTESRIESASFNNNVAVPTVTNANTYEMYWTNSKVYFVTNGTLLHTHNAATATWSNALTLPAREENNNYSGGTANVALNVRTSTIYRMGDIITQAMSAFQVGTTAGTLLKYGAGNIHGMNISAVTNNGNVTLYDALGTTATPLYSTGAMGAVTTPFSIDMFDAPFSTGLYLTITGAAASAFIAYE